MKFRWRIRHKLAAGLALVIGMTGLLSAGSFYGLYSYRRSNKLFSYHQEQLAILGSLELAVSGLNFPGRELADSFPDQDTATAAQQDRLARIQQMVDKYGKSLQKAAESGFSAESAEKQAAELERMTDHIQSLMQSVTNAKPMASANQVFNLWRVGSKRDVIAELIHSLQRLRGVIHTEITQHVEADRTNYRLSLAAVYSTTVLVLVMLIGLVLLGYRALFHPIRELHQGVTKLANGNFDSRVRLYSGDEIQELGEAFNEMADRLQGTYKELNQQVEERSRQLIRSERLASVGFLAAGVAHEINNPLASIAFCAEALEGRLKEHLPEDDENAEVVHNYLTMIQQEAFRCKGITEKLLDFSRVGEAEKVDTDVAGLVRNVLEMVQHLGRANGKHLIYEPADELIAKVNPQELKQVLLNLIINGLESTDEGGTVTITSRSRDGEIEISVQDDGCGMGPEVLQNLFEPFFTRSRTGRGTGLGLSISHLIISQHGGSLDATSPGEGKGSTFTVRLPAHAPAPQLAKAA